MKTIILGRTGNQAFPIKDQFDGVSHKHAEITINDNGDWYLKDLNSTNGTYIRDEKTGERIPVTEERLISPMTFIFLGPDNYFGCCFFAKQAVSYGDFHEDYLYLQSKQEEFDNQIKAIDKKVRRIKWIVLIFNIIIVFYSIYDKTNGVDFLRCGTLLSSFFAAAYDANGAKEQIKLLKQYKFSHCPNPICCKKLTPQEIMAMMCSKCKNRREK